VIKIYIAEKLKLLHGKRIKGRANVNTYLRQMEKAIEVFDASSIVLG
jgi:hypothetical protein